MPGRGQAGKYGVKRTLTERLPTLLARDLPTLLPHNWRPPGAAA